MGAVELLRIFLLASAGFGQELSKTTVRTIQKNTSDRIASSVGAYVSESFTILFLVSVQPGYTEKEGFFSCKGGSGATLFLLSLCFQKHLDF